MMTEQEEDFRLDWLGTADGSPVWILRERVGGEWTDVGTYNLPPPVQMAALEQWLIKTTGMSDALANTFVASLHRNDPEKFEV
jgi:hypothetical protein